jgi:hypothetical protein
MPTLRVKRCGGIPAKVMVLRNSVLIAIAWSSPFPPNLPTKIHALARALPRQSEC